MREYRGRPTLVDVTRTIDILREEKAAEYRRNEGRRITEEMRELQKRKDSGEEFFGWGDVLKAGQNLARKRDRNGAMVPGKTMPVGKKEFADIDTERNRATLEQQAKKLLNS